MQFIAQIYSNLCHFSIPYNNFQKLQILFPALYALRTWPPLQLSYHEDSRLYKSIYGRDDNDNRKGVVPLHSANTLLNFLRSNDS